MAALCADCLTAIAAISTTVFVTGFRFVRIDKCGDPLSLETRTKLRKPCDQALGKRPPGSRAELPRAFQSPGHVRQRPLSSEDKGTFVKERLPNYEVQG
jgi:hypothetical protein